MSHAILVPTSPKTQSVPVSLSPPASLPSSPRNASTPAPSTLTSHFVQALHDYLPTNAPADEAVSCLFFRKGAIIEVFNRDSSGWWDGLSGGVRGWFPSNYVGRIGEAVRHSADFEDEESQQEWEAWRKHATPVTEEEPLIISDQIPETTQEQTIKTKQSRVELARALLNEDRRKSNSSTLIPTTPTALLPEKDDQQRYMDDQQQQQQTTKIPAIPSWENLMEDVSLRMSELVNTCGTSNNIEVAIFQVVSSIRAVLTAANTVNNDSPILKSHSELARQRKIILSALSKLVLKGKELQNQQQRVKDDHQKIPLLANQLLTEMGTFEEILKTVPEFMESKIIITNDGVDDQTQYETHNSSISPRSSLISVESTGSNSGTSQLLRQQLVDARLSSVSLIAKAVPLSDAQHILQTLLENQASIDDLITNLLATIEKFLANRQHATEMLETTRKAVESVRNFLAIVEHVCSNVGDIDYKHYSVIPEDPHLVALVLAKESVYSAITNLVTSVRALAGPRNRRQSSCEQDYDNLRESCENVVRATNDSAARVRICLQVDIINGNTADEENKANEDNDDHVKEMREKLESSVDTRRNQTLSILGRKVTSLNVLQHQYSTNNGDYGNNQEDEKHRDLLPPPEIPNNSSCTSLEKVDEDEIENLEVAQQGKQQQKEQEQQQQQQNNTSTPPVPPNEIPRRSRALSKASRNSKLSRSETVRRSNNVPVPPRGSSAASSIRTSSGASSQLLRQSTQSTESINSTPMTTPETMSPVNDMNVYPVMPPPTYQQNGIVAIPPPPPPKGSIKPYPELKILSSKSTPTGDQSHRSRRPREMSISAFRMSLKNRNDDHQQRNSSASTETLVEQPRIRRTSSYVSIAERRDSVQPQEHNITKTEEVPWFLKQRVFSDDEMMFNSEGQVTGATVEALVEKLTQHEKSPELMFTRAFFYNFRLFTTPVKFLELLIKRFELQPPTDPQLNSDELAAWTSHVLIPVRLRVCNVIKTWLETYFCYEPDACTENALIDFTVGPMMQAMAGSSKRMMDLIRKRFTSKGGTNQGRKLSYTNEPRPTLQKQPSGSHISLSAGTSLFSNLALFEDHHSEPAAAPPSNINRSLRNTLRKAMSQGVLSNIHINEFDTLELARQLTLMESSLFCQIQPNEMIGQEFKKKVGSSSAIHVKAMIQRSTQITSWVSDTILHESDVKKRAQMIKLWIKIGDHCLQLQNYNTLMAIRSALDSTSIARLKRTWEHVSGKYKAMYDPIYRATDSQRNFAEYRRRLKKAIAPCLPFLGVYLTDMTFIDDGNSNHRTSPNQGVQLINFDKYIKTTRVLNDIDQFQISYKLSEVEEIQRYLLQCLETVQKDDQVFYTRSLQLEPREEEFDIKSFISNLA
ncbi:ras guanine nucleotide exchange factor domain-containing protein [Circinella umbellata]|nr:ras guanine nucleotide exchange factor domain-containing protein [Circinella umbellata]